VWLAAQASRLSKAEEQENKDKNKSPSRERGFSELLAAIFSELLE
jgi:hypothetical protein